MNGIRRSDAWLNPDASVIKIPLLNRAAMKVPGRNTIVKMAIVFIEELSCNMLNAI